MNTDKHRFLIQILLLSVFICVHLWLIPGCFAATAPEFEKRWLSGVFYGEGANFGDFNHDGKLDVVSGPYIYDGPDFVVKHEFMERVQCDPLGYSKNFLAYARDFNGDGYDDIFIIGFPGEEAVWYENPKGAQPDDKNNRWTRHLVLKSVDNESPMLMPDSAMLVCMSGGQIGYATPDKSDPAKPWTWHPISPKSDAYQRFTHGLGVGDVNGDGRFDILEKSGWWEQPAAGPASAGPSSPPDALWKKHDFEFSKPGGAQMYAYDIDGDGDNDVITSLAAHGYGLAWYEQVKDGDAITFKQHLILSPKPDEKLNDLQFSQLHAVELIDMDNDDLNDIVTGKRYWAHGPAGDPEPEAPPVLYWFKLTRDNGKASYEPIMIDNRSGVGTMVAAQDVNGDKKADVVVGNKRGTVVFVSK